MEILRSPTEFEWDKHNGEHVRKHRVEPGECEQVFFNIPLTLAPDLVRAHAEKRYFVLGKTHGNRVLVIIFTMRRSKIRVITARDASRKERARYEA